MIRLLTKPIKSILIRVNLFATLAGISLMALIFPGIVIDMLNEFDSTQINLLNPNKKEKQP